MTAQLRPPRDPARLTLGRFLADVAAHYGERCAIRYAGQDLSYAGLEAASRSLARGLVGAGVGKGSRVALWLANRPEWAVALFAAARVGAVLVPVNTFATPGERDHVLRHADAALLLMQRALLGRDLLAELCASHAALADGAPGRLRCEALPQLRRVACLGLETARGGIGTWPELVDLGADVSDALLDAILAEVAPADDALVVYTSGTTALPKGILHAQRAPVLQSWRFAELLGLGPEDRVLSAQPFFWTAGIAMSLGASLAAGATLILEERFEPGAFLACIEAERVTALHAWPHQERQLAQHPSARERDLRSLRKLAFDSPLAPLVGLERDAWGMQAAYGLSETFTLASALPASAPAELRRASSGRPLPGLRVRVVDPASGEPLLAGAAGEIAVQGTTLMRGYLKQEPERYLDEAGFFRTGDGGFLDAEGYLHWTGRMTNLIKTGGANVSPEEIEAALREHPELALAQAVGVPHPHLGEVVVLCAVAAPGATPSEPELRAWLRARLAAYKLPKRVLFFRADELRFTGSAKLQTPALRDAALQRLEAQRVEIDGFHYGQPRQS